MKRLGKKIRGYDLNKVFDVRDTLYDKAFAGMVGVKADKESLDLVVDRAVEILPGSPSRLAVFRSLEHLAGNAPSMQEAYENSWRLAGNYKALTEGKVVRPWTRQLEPDWVPFQIMDYEYLLSGPKIFDEEKKFYQAFRLQVLAGAPCPLRILKNWTRTAVPLVAKTLGFTRSYGAHPYRHNPRQLVGMRFLGLVENKFCKEERPGFFEIKATPSVLKWNRRLLKMRERLPATAGDDSFECMEEYSPFDVPCHNCFRGYTTCPAGCHPYDYEEGVCSKCEQSAWIDRTREQDVCINCSMARKR